MGVIEGTYITLTNYEKKKIEELEKGGKLLSCKIEGLEPLPHSNIAMSWTNEEPTILKEESSVGYTYRESVAIYRIINNKLKISLDHVIFTKDGETDECSWNNVKSLRRGDFIFNESYEFEEITSLKKIKKEISTITLSLSGYPYYFANGYLIHNNQPCEGCLSCWKIARSILTPYGPHNSNLETPSNFLKHASGLTQKQAYDRSGTNIPTLQLPGSGNSGCIDVLPFNDYTGTLKYKRESADVGQPVDYYLYKEHDGWKLTKSLNTVNSNSIITAWFDDGNQTSHYFSIQDRENSNNDWIKAKYKNDRDAVNNNNTELHTWNRYSAKSDQVGGAPKLKDWGGNSVSVITGSSGETFYFYYVLEGDLGEHDITYQFRIRSSPDSNTSNYTYREPANDDADDTDGRNFFNIIMV